MSEKQAKAQRLKEKYVTSVFWTETPEGYVPAIQVFDIAFALEPRPIRQFYEGEREAAMFHIGNVISEKLFGVSRFLGNVYGDVVQNPQWDDLESIPIQVKTGEPVPQKIVGLDGNPVN